jgi:DNA-binding NarL/FixJ family response regulator
MEKIISVCVVEDIKEIRLTVKGILTESKEFVCFGAFENAEDAAELLPDLNPDIVLVDINLPGMSGIECIRKIKSKCPNTQFMMFTIYEDSDSVFEALAAGASGYLLKKTPHDKILEAVKELHDGGSPMSMQIARKVVNAFQKSSQGSGKVDELSAREKEVLQLLSRGYLYKEIGGKLNISTGTVRQHIHKIYEKLHVQNRTEAINKFYGKG